MVGVDQTPAPEGPQVCVPVEVFARRVGASEMVYVFHTCAPSATRRAVMLPRNVQHSYAGFVERVSSQDAAGKNATPLCTAGAPVSRVASCCSTFFFQICLPLDASIP